MEKADRIPPAQRGHLEQWSSRLRSAFHDAEDILNIVDYHRLKKQLLQWEEGRRLVVDEAMATRGVGGR
ncbi:hypothetical protein E2562_023472 [Oryza meyeriana var. granulata]|uniref:Rx N-terminal domain-containing protein n=1 Tax=Oryza meyeriana var. granulata TaxID=110450 RepID=A0A6G1BZ94_9ORYZ|nr:hypothetical protein E2562_023472 [Oryza meyeriana var. granulata]